MFSGLAAGILWGLDTVILGIAMAMSPFVSTEEAVFLAPFVSTFLHDLCSSVWMLLYMGIRRQLRNVVRALKTKSGKFIVLGALLGGPVGMSGYVAAIHYIGPAYTAMISAMFPALGALLSYIFLKEKMKPVQLFGVAVCIAGVIVLGYTPDSMGGKSLLPGIICALLCCVGWASEAVICAYGMKSSDITNEQALQIRQVTSAVFYGIVLLNVLRGWKFTKTVVLTSAFPVVLIAALFGTASYVFYYKAIAAVGPSKAMALDITYSAWAMAISAILFRELPEVKSIICGVMILAGSLVAATDIKKETSNSLEP